MSDLPPGFVLDQPKGAPLPAGFVLDGVKPQTQSDALGTSVGQGATFGFGDELTAAVRAALPAVSNFMMRDAVNPQEAQTVSTKPTFGERYDEELAKSRAQNKANEKAYPVTTTAGNIAGNLATTVLALPEAALSMGPSVLGNAAKYAGVSGALGGVQGFGEGEGGFANRALNAVASAVPAAVIGGSIPVAARVGRAVAESAPGRAVGDYVVGPIKRALTGAATQTAPATTAESGAIERIATAMQRGGLMPQEVSGRLAKIGPDAVLADVDPQFFSQARMAHTMPGETRTLAPQVLEARDARLPAYMREGFTGDTPPPATVDLIGPGQQYEQIARQVGNDAYGAMGGDKLKLSAEMQQIMRDAPAIPQTLNQIQQDAAQNGVKLNPIELFDRLKQQLNRNADAAFANGKAVNKADVGNLADRFEQAFWRANPKAQEAATLYAQAKSLPENFQAGYDFLANAGTNEKALNASSQALARRIAGNVPQQTEAVQAGLTNRAVDLTSGRNALGNTRSLARDVKFGEEIQNRLAQVYGDAQAADILRRAEGVRQMTKTSQGILGGSQSTDKAAEALDTGNLGVRMTDRGITPGFRETLKNIVGHVVNPNEAIRNEIGKAMLTADPKENARIIALAEALLKRRAAGSPIRAVLPAALTNQAAKELQ